MTLVVMVMIRLNDFRHEKTIKILFSLIKKHGPRQCLNHSKRI